MTIVLSTGARDAIVDALANPGFNSGVLEIRTGSPPGPNNADAGTLLASMTLPADAHNPSSSGSATKAGTWQDASANNSGTAGHFRIKRSGDAGGSSTTAVRIEGTITTSGGGGDMIADSTTITAGQPITCNTFTISKAA